jgi:hypothetical protein
MRLAKLLNVTPVASMSYHPQRAVLAREFEVEIAMRLTELAAEGPSANIAPIIPVGLVEVGALPRSHLDMPGEIGFSVD